jgi:hypothetical protein
VTNKERERIREAARRYVHEQAPSPPMETLERVARIVLQARVSDRSGPEPDLAARDAGRADAA